MADLTRVAEVLAEHGETTMTVRGWCCYGCGASYGRLGSTLRGQRAAHQAQMLADAGLVASETEWGRRSRGTGTIYPLSGEPFPDWWGESQVGYEHMRREVTPWRPADEGGEA